MAGYLTLGMPGSSNRSVHRLAGSSKADLGKRGAALVRAFARRRGVSPLAIDYEFTPI